MTLSAAAMTADRRQSRLRTVPAPLVVLWSGGDSPCALLGSPTSPLTKLSGLLIASLPEARIIAHLPPVCRSVRAGCCREARGRSGLADTALHQQTLAFAHESHGTAVHHKERGIAVVGRACHEVISTSTRTCG